MEKKYVGLTTNDLEKNQKMYGNNTIIYNIKNKLLKNIIKIIKEPIFLLLLICITMFVILREYTYTIVLLTSIIGILIVKLYQVFKTNKIENTIKKFISPNCTVVRNGKEQTVLEENITIDDILLLKEGDSISADAIILENYNLYADESYFTNDNTPVKKSYDLMDKNALLKSNYVYKGTFITKGYGIAKVVSIGNNTEMAKTNTHQEQVNCDNSTIQKLTKKTDKTCVIIAIIVLILTFVLGIVYKINMLNALINAMTVSLVCLLSRVTLPIKYLISKEKEYIARKNVIIKDNLTIENLNKITCLCIDKDEFITENNIIIKQICPLKKDTELIMDALLSSQDYGNELYQKAFENYLENKNININYNHYKLIKKYKYNNKIKLEANIYEYENENYIYVKGNLESIFDVCNLNLDIKYQLHNLEKEYSKQGLEVIAVASKKVDKIEKNILNYDDIEFSGIIGLYKPPKENCKELIDRIQKENIKIIMMSKYNKDISTHIGKILGINNSGNLISSKEMDKISDEKLTTLIKHIGIIYDISEQNKNKLINILKKNNEVIGITGNEITDNTIVNNADILITTKQSGTDISNNLSNIILLDNDLETIITAINYSKLITRKTRKFIFYNIIFHILIMILSIIISSIVNQILLNIICVLILEIIYNLTHTIVLNYKKY